MLIAQISDTHLLLEGDGAAQRIRDFERVIADINALDPVPDVIIHTGDIVHNGREDEYGMAARILETAKPPVYVLPGNKDERANLSAAFSPQGYIAADAPFIDYAVEDFPVRLIVLDTLNPGSNKGDFCERRVARLKDIAANGDGRPVAVFAHHPPFEVDVGPDPVHFDDRQAMERMRESIQAIGNPAGFFCGHVHRFASGSIGNIPATVVTAVSTALRKGEYAQEADGKPLYYLHSFGADGAFTTQMRISG